MYTKKPGLTRLELATSAVTGRCSNQLNYNPILIFMINKTLKAVNLFLLLLIEEKQGFEPWVHVMYDRLAIYCFRPLSHFS